MAKEKTAADNTATLFIQQATLTEQAAVVVAATTNALNSASWEFKDGKADISQPLSTAWNTHMASIGVTEEQSAAVTIAATVTFPYATMNATAEAAMKRHSETKEAQNLHVTGKAAGGTLTFTGDASVSSTYASASGSSTVTHQSQNPLVRQTQTNLQKHLDNVRSAESTAK